MSNDDGKKPRPQRPSGLTRLRRFARHGSVVWIVLLLLTGSATVSQLMHSHRSKKTRQTSSAESGAPDAPDRGLYLFAGIPQHGTTLGDPHAPNELIEFADLQCPYCAAVSRALIPPLIDRYVRTGQVKIVFRTLDFVGPDSERLAKVAGATAMQDHLFQFVHLAFAQQGRESSG